MALTFMQMAFSRSMGYEVVPSSSRADLSLELSRRSSAAVHASPGLEAAISNRPLEYLDVAVAVESMCLVKLSLRYPDGYSRG